MAEIDRERKQGPAAIISGENNQYNITYFVPAQQAMEALDRHYTVKLPPGKSLLPHEEATEEDRENAPLLSDHRELYLPSDIMDLSVEALACLDNNQYKLSYYIKLKEYYREKQEFDTKSHGKDDKETNTPSETMDPLLFYSKERAEMTAKALSEMDGHQRKMSYYVELEDYYKKTREHEDKMLYYNAGDRDAFKDKPLPLMFYSGETTDLSAKALSELDGKQHKMSYYEKLRKYQAERAEYERKLLLYELGQTDIFEKKEEDTVPQDKYAPSPEALCHIDGQQHKFSYYEKLSNYYREIQDCNKKLEEHNFDDPFNASINSLFLEEKERVTLSAKALSELDGKQHKMSYYEKLARYNRELEEYERKTDLYNAGDMDVFEKEEVILAKDIVTIGPQKEEQLIDVKDEVTIGSGNKNTAKIWTPDVNDMISALKGKLSPYFIDNLFETMQKVDKTFDPSLNRLPLLRIYLTCSTELVSEEELLKELQML
ncbi:MAG: hypothetical protein ABRQ39_21885 [Candidatus Eremiobacterota bacterium]